ncbi:MAG TPA: contact-dependent growth inhibition system immunity protein [Pyrinomonadaceae bacterium]|nr:contact-dependent growth inhibition system immunity protein [Pyrinomonadaceae bacterium]
MVTIKDKTLEELDGERWAEPDHNSSLVLNCRRLRHIPLKNFTIEDLRLMIGQEIGLEYLIPLALEHLERNPFAEGDFYPGDLLKNVLEVRREFWNQHPDLRRKISSILEDAVSNLDKIEDAGIAESISNSLYGFG